MIRRIIQIDEEKCNGCGACAAACHESAIGMVDGKAKLLRDDYCDGLGDCLPACPTGAITCVEREAAAYDEAAVIRNQRPLQQWPVQIKLVPTSAPYFDGAKLLIAADCTAYAYASFHEDFKNEKIVLVGCPKLAFFPEDWVLEHAQGEKNLYHAIGKQEDLTDYIVHTPYENLDLVPSSTLMSSIEYELFTKWQREFILRKCLQKIKDSEVYDYILIDAPPTLGGWVMNILCASDKVIIPVEASPWGMFGLANMFEFLNEVKQISPDLEVAGIAVTKVDTRKNYFKQTMETLHQLESIYVFEHVIRVDSSVEWSQDNSVPVVEYKKSSRSAKEYTELAEEVMNRVSR